MKQRVKKYKDAVKNPLYMQFKEERDEIMKDYPPTSYCSVEEIRERTKRIADLMFQNDGNFNKWFWEEYNSEIKTNIEKVNDYIHYKRNQNSNYDYRL